MWCPRPVPIVILAVNLMTAACGGGGGAAAPAAPSEPSLEPVTRSFAGDWRGDIPQHRYPCHVTLWGRGCST